jgi:signal recognition particle receptor subunit beta
LSENPRTAFIVVAGPSGSGKTAFIRSLSTAAGERQVVATRERVVDGYRLLYDYGTITVDESLRVQLLAPPAARDVRLAHQLPAQTLGVILLVSSAEPDRLPAAREFVAEYVACCSVPFVVAATKADQPGALPVDVLRTALDLPPDRPLYPCVAVDPDSARGVVMALLHILIDAIEAAEKARLQQDSTD